jgi:hypothetical protein
LVVGTNLMMKRTTGWHAALLVATTLLAAPAFATEGGSGAYLLGTRDSLAGIVPPPGTYISVDVVNISGTAPLLSIGGAILVDPKIDVTVIKTNFTHSFSQKVLGGRFAVTITQPVVTGSIAFNGVYRGFGRALKDSNTGLGDTTITPSLGFDSGNSHWALQTSFFLPLGYWQASAIDIPNRDLQALSFGKNRFAAQPVVNYTYLNMKNGREFSGSASILFSARNTATDYQTAPEFNLEMAALQHLKSGLAFGPAGYFYQQLGNDSGSGAAGGLWCQFAEVTGVRRRAADHLQHQDRQPQPVVQSQIHLGVRGKAPR